MQHPKSILEITYVDPICNTLIWVLNQYLIVVSHNTKEKKSSSIAIPLFDLPYSYWGYAVSAWVY
jgi:hypothetical protein